VAAQMNTARIERGGRERCDVARMIRSRVAFVCIALIAPVIALAEITFPAVEPASTFASESKDWGVEPTAMLKGHPYNVPTPRAIPGARVISTLQLMALLDAGDSMVVIDVLNSRVRTTVPGAYWMPGAGNHRFNEALTSAFAAALEILSLGDKTRPLVFLCLGSECWESYNAALHAVSAGYTDVIWYRGGSSAWASAGFPLKKPLQFEWTGGREMAQVATSLSNFAARFQADGRNARAESLYRHALAIREETLGPDHTAVADTLSSLGGLYQLQGRYSGAEPLYKRALSISEKAFGPDDPAVGQMMAKMAALYQVLGRYVDAESFYKRDVAIREKALGPQHPDLAAALNRLGALHKAQGRYADAEALYRRAITIQEQKPGVGGLEVARTLNNMGELYAMQGRYADAESAYRRALGITEAAGAEERELARTLGNLALAARAQGHYSEADALFARSEAINKKVRQPK